MLPDNYKFLLKNYNGGGPDAKEFGAIDEETGILLGYELYNFYFVNENIERPLTIWWAIENYSEWIGPNTLPFADNDYNQIYYLKRNNDASQVWILKFPTEEEEPETYFLMNSFDELLGALI